MLKYWVIVETCDDSGDAIDAKVFTFSSFAKAAVFFDAAIDVRADYAQREHDSGNMYSNDYSMSKRVCSVVNDFITKTIYEFEYTSDDYAHDYLA